MTTETRKLAILICSAGPDRPELCVTPLIHAQAARALDCEVEIHVAGPAVRLLVEGVAEKLFPGVQKEKSVLDFLRETAALDVGIFACGMAQANYLNKGEGLIAECRGAAGATAFVARVIDDAWKTLVF